MPAGLFPASSSVGAESTVSLFYKEAELHTAASPFSRIRHFCFKPGGVRIAGGGSAWGILASPEQAGSAVPRRDMLLQKRN